MEQNMISENTVPNTQKITEDGLFYSNFDRKKFPLFLMPESENYSEYLVWIKDNYGIKIGRPQLDSAGSVTRNTIGIYIVDYERYLSDINKGLHADETKGGR